MADFFMDNVEMWVAPVELTQFFNEASFKAYTTPSGRFEKPLYRRVKAVVSTSKWKVTAVDLVEGQVKFVHRGI
jgi:hypothetical protein